MYYVRKPQDCKNRKLLRKKHSSNRILQEKYNTEKWWADLNFLFQRNLLPSAERIPFSLNFVVKTTLLSDESIQTFNTSQLILNYLPQFKINCKKFHLKFASDYLRHCSRWMEICCLLFCNDKTGSRTAYHLVSSSKRNYKASFFSHNVKRIRDTMTIELIIQW